MENIRTPKKQFRAHGKQNASRAALCAALAAWPGAALADFDINSGNTYQASAIGSNAPSFKGGTLQMDSSTTISNAFTVTDVSTNTIDANGRAVTLSGAFTGAGPLTFTDSAGGGAITLTNSGNSYTGATTINSGATVLLSGSGTLASSSGITANGTLDISQTTSGVSLVSLSGSGSVALGGQTLTITSGSGSFGGVISGSGGLTLSSGTQILTGANTYSGVTTITSGTLILGNGGTSGSLAGNVITAGTLAVNRSDTVTFNTIVSGSGGLSQTGTGTLLINAVNTYTGVTTISSGTLALSSSGSIASSSVTANGIFDISATSGASIKSLSGNGTVQLGNQTLTLTAANGTFSGTITGSGGLVMNGGTQMLAGTSSFTGSTIINGGVLQIGSATYSSNVTANGGTFAFNSASAIAMTGIVSGAGGVQQQGTGVTTISTAQTYTGVTTITAGTLALSGSGSIASSVGVVNNGTFSIAGVAGSAAITSLSGSGTVQLGSQTLVITNASGNFTGVIAGTGGLTLNGGNQTLSGTSSYSGVTTIQAGTLFLAGTSSLAGSTKVVNNAVLDVSLVADAGGGTSTAIVSLAGNGSVVLGSKTLLLTNAGDSFSGIISGTGGVTVAGGTQTLAGQNSYGGDTTISGGALALAGSGGLSSTGRVVNNAIFDISLLANSDTSIASLSGTGSVNLGAKTLTLTSASDTFRGIILGSGGLVINGGTQILSGNNTYTGGTVIAAGTLQVGRGSGSGAITGDVVNNGTLAFSRNDTYVFTGAVSGSGKLVQTGDGTTVLTQASSYTGGTTIAAGTLQIGNGGTTGSILGNVANSGTLAFARSDTVFFDGTISGTGSVNQLSGSTVLTAVNSYTGATTVASGATLSLGASGSIAASSGVTANGLFDVSNANLPRITSLSGSGSVALGSQSLTITAGSGKFAGAITGSGDLILNGGSQTLSGVSSYGGATTVNGGTLIVDGSIAASRSVTVNSGATLAGSGTVSGVTLNGNSTLSPGTSGAGTLHVNGTVTFSNASNFIVTTTSTSASKLEVSGSQSLAGTLSVAGADGDLLLGQKMTVLTASGGVNGTFAVASLVTTGAQFSQTLSYDANNVYLQIDLAKLSPLLPTDATVNQTSVVTGIDNAITAGRSLPVAFQNLGLKSSEDLATATGQLAGEIGSDLPAAGEALFNPFMDAMFDHMHAAQRSGPQRNVWLSGFSGSTVFGADTDSGTQKLRASATGFAAGADWVITPRLTLGGAVSAGAAGLNLADGSHGHAKALQGGIYSQYRFRPRVYGSFAAVLGQQDIDTTRTVTVSGTDVLTAKPQATLYGLRYETGIELRGLTPYFALQDRLFQTSSYTETAASGASTFALDYASRSFNMPSLELGVRMAQDYALNRNWTITLSDKLALSHNFFGQWDTRAAFAAVPDSDFTIQGASPGSDAGLISLGAALRNRMGLAVNLRLNSTVSSKAQTYTGLVGITMAW
jgi:autotransporter-associated beta strand protein